MTTATTTRVFHVEGMSCDHCVRAVSEEIHALPGVVDVAVDLGEPSVLTVTATSSLGESDVAAALDEAGDYRLLER
jgi:copper chaperone CopZ